jgi:hypothetical protein
MRLTIELTPEQEARLTAAAQQRGLGPAELAQELLTVHLPELTPVNGDPSGATERDPELVARVGAIRGKYAHLGVTTEDLRRERQADRERLEL